MGKFFHEMRILLSANYVVPAVLLNPILFLHSVNALLSRLLPPISVDAPIQPSPYYPLGPSGEHPHLNMHTNDNLCWSYTIVMVFAQLVAFGRISRQRQEMRDQDAQAKELSYAGKMGIVEPGIIRRLSEREIPLEREAYSSDEETHRTAEKLANGGRIPYADKLNANGLNGHAVPPIQTLKTTVVR